jgi:excinuclease ABC subunit C
MSDKRCFDSKAFLKTLPHKPGVYRMIGVNDEVLYVGKAKDLKSRVSSYFTGKLVNSRIWSMVNQVQDVQITITNTEAEALLLESNLIKKHKTRYNVLLRDDKSYPYIFVSTKDEFPRITFHRGSRRRSGEYFGPYPSAGAVREALNLLQKLFQVRQCEDSYFANRSRPCLQYQIKRCTAPCTDEISAKDYRMSVNHSMAFLNGKSEGVINELVEQMEQAAEQLAFEKAADIRDRIEKLRQISQQQYVSGGQGNVDVIALQYASGVASVQVFTIRRGNNLGNKNFFPKLPNLDVNEEEILASFVSQYYLSHEIPGDILFSQLPDNRDVLSEMLTLKAGHKVSFFSNVRGERARWVEMASRNALHALQVQLQSKSGMQDRLLALQEALQLDYIPMRMECFDISHTMGEATVASCVVFGTEGAMKQEYRRFNIKGIEPGDDYAAMKQVLERRFKKAVETIEHNDAKLPDILFIDGGKGQVAQAIQVLTDLQVSGVDIVGVAKGEGRKPGLETLIVENGQERINLPEHSKALHLIQQIRDESHRFAITGHRQKREKARTTSPLENIPGLGPKRRQQLLKQFGGIRAISRASIEELTKVQGISRQLAELIYDRFNTDQ